MGIVEFFGTITSSNLTESALSTDHKKSINMNHFFVDFNSIIHVESVNLLSIINLLQYSCLSHIYNNDSKKKGQTSTLPSNVYNVEITQSMLKSYGLDNVIKMIFFDDNCVPIDVINIFKTHFDQDSLDKMIYHAVSSNLVNMVQKYCDQKTLKTLMIAIDGVPSKGKLMEQRQRKYMGSIVSTYNKYLLQKHKSYLKKMPYYTYLAHKHSISWSKTKITPGTHFMDKLSAHLRSEKITYVLMKKNPKLKIIISDSHEIGEGEKKIVNYIETNMPKSTKKIVIYSPDSDVILLCILLSTPNIHMFRFDQQKSTDTHPVYDLIDVSKMKQNFSMYIESKLGKPVEVNKINKDLVFIITFFGNDFISRMETVNVSSDFNIILDVYVDALQELSESKIKYLIRHSKSKNIDIPSLEMLKIILKRLLPIETEYINDNTGYQTYVNYGRVKHIMSSYQDVNINNIYSVIAKIEGVYNNIKQLIGARKETTDIIKEYELDPYLFNTIKLALGTVKFMNNNYIIPKMNNVQMIEFLKMYYLHFKGKKIRFPKLYTRLNKPIDTLNSPYFRHLDITSMDPYQLEMTQFNETVDGYNEILNKKPLNLSKNGVSKYYKEYFDVDQKYSNALSKSTIPVLHHYLQAMLWVFNYYYNDKSYISNWYYIYERSPLLKQISAYVDSLDNVSFVAIFDDLKKYQIEDISKYFNPVEQLVYVCPLTNTNISLFPNSYQDFFHGIVESNDNKKYPDFIKQNYVNVNDIVTRIIDNDTEIIDCKSIRYLSKCIIKTLHKPSASYDKKFLTFTRNNIKQTKQVLSRERSTIPPF